MLKLAHLRHGITVVFFCFTELVLLKAVLLAQAHSLTFQMAKFTLKQGQIFNERVSIHSIHHIDKGILVFFPFWNLHVKQSKVKGVMMFCSCLMKTIQSKACTLVL